MNCRSQTALGGGCVCAKAGFCARLNKAEADRLCAAAEQNSYSAGETIPEGRSGATGFLIRDGIAKLVHMLSDGRRQVVELLFAGDLLFTGEDVTDGERHIEAGTRLRLCRIPREALCMTGRRGLRCNETLIEAVLTELERKNGQLLTLGRKRSDERVASFLLEYAMRDGGRGRVAGPVDLGISRTDIADYLCLTKETVSRCFALLRDEGLIRLASAERIELLDLTALGRRANADALVRPE